MTCARRAAVALGVGTENRDENGVACARLVLGGLARARCGTRRPLRQPLALPSFRSTPTAVWARSTGRSTASSSNTSTTRSWMVSSQSRSAAADSRGATSRRTGHRLDRRTRCASSRLRSSMARKACGSPPAASDRESGNGECSWSPAGAMTGAVDQDRVGRAACCHCACWRRMDDVLADLPLQTRGSAWQEVPFSFASARSDRDAAVEIAAAGRGAALVDFVSLMRADVRGAACCVPISSPRFADWRPRSSAGPAGRLPQPTSGRMASARSPRASTTRTKYGAATPITTASAPTSTWS